MTDPNPDSSACLHHPSNSVGWNCSNIAAYPTVPVGFIMPPLHGHQASAVSYFSDRGSLHPLSTVYNCSVRVDSRPTRAGTHPDLMPETCCLLKNDPVR